MLADRLKKGDTIGIIAPSDPVTEENMEEFNASKKALEDLGFNIKIGKYVYANTLGYGSTPKEKAEDFNNMFLDREVKFVYCAKGGYDCNSLFDYIDYQAVKNNPKIICGYSDTTMLLNNIYNKTGLVTFHGQTFKSLATQETEYSFDEIKKRLIENNKEIGQKEDIYTCIKPGVEEGILIGGNLYCLSRLVSGKYKMDFDNKILFLEDLGFESCPAFVNSYLYIMKQEGVFDKIKGIWLGNYEHESGISIEKIVLDVIGDEYNFPIIKSDNFGHTDKKTVVPIGLEVRLDANNCEIELLEDFLK